MTYLLSTSEREALIRALADAPDEILIDAVRQRKDWMKNIKSSFDEVRSFVGMKVTESSKPPPVSAGGIPVVKSAPQEVASTSTDLTPEQKKIWSKAPRIDISPGPPTIGKIGTKTKDWIIGELKTKPRVPEHFGTKYEEHLKLLWLRHEIKFDGKEYFYE